MTLHELDRLLSEYLRIPDFPNDPSQNGIQVERSGGDLRKIALGVDACLETIRRAADQGADLLLTHHGLLWGQSEPLRGLYYGRVRALMESNMALYACHLPLDAHPECGNNYGLAARLGLRDIRPCCEWRGYTIGVTGALPEPLSPDDLIRKLFPSAQGDCIVLPFGKPRAERAAIVTGGGGEEVSQARDAGADLFITGEIGHTQFHTAEELGITVIAAGHYRTETIGVQLLGQKITRDTGIETVFIDVPTGL
ncbi:MAG: Nif3-like dinuclear metal center hexameric protein [Spirochaetaceae bacterium]|jgi:dinuclear metal center YbgI/SA1388 family protein|nr:Nif3-like dinuclear metal center hexameric protein [Spirochaetaceae bacterium]